MAGLEEGSLDDCRVQDSSDESHTPLKEKQSFLVLFIVNGVIINILRVVNTIDPPPYFRRHRQGHGECDAEDGDPLSHSSPFSVVLMIPLLSDPFLPSWPSLSPLCCLMTRPIWVVFVQ